MSKSENDPSSERKPGEMRQLGLQVSQFLKTRKGRLLPEEENEMPAILNSMDTDFYHFKDEEPLKIGGEKVIFKAYDPRTDRQVAIARPKDSQTTRGKEAFLREARITSSLQHPNILPVYEIGLDHDQQPFFVMRLLKGEDLGSIVKRQIENKARDHDRHWLEDLMTVFLKLCGAMTYAHSQGVLHLDIKPANVMIGRFGEVHLLDWGLSTVMEKERSHLDPDLLNSIATTGTMQGTPGFMAPEQLSGLSRESVQTDVYALGALLYFMLTGTIPVKGTDAADVQNNTRAGRIIPPQKRRPGLPIPDSLSAVALKALALKPEDRYQTVEELSDEVSRYLRGFAPAAERASPLKRMQLLVKRHNQVSTALLIAGVALITVIGIFYQRERLQSQRLELARAEAVANLERFLEEQEVSETLHGHLLGFTGNIAAFTDVLAFSGAREFMAHELQNNNLSAEYRNRLLWYKAHLELANQEFNAAMQTIRECELDLEGNVMDLARTFAELKPDDADLLTVDQFVDFLASFRKGRFSSNLMSLAFDLDAARREAPDPNAYLKVVISHLNQLNSTPGWGDDVQLVEVEGGYHLDLSGAPYQRYRLTRMRPQPVFGKLGLVSLDLSGTEFRLEDGSPFAGELETLVLLDIRSLYQSRLMSTLRNLPPTRLVFREGFLSRGQHRRLDRTHEIVELAEGEAWNIGQ
jgi:serine/threonine-protein kinase